MPRHAQEGCTGLVEGDVADLKWISANAAALALANAAVPGVFWLAWSVGLSDVMIFAAVGTVWGLSIGLAQVWAAHPPRSRAWVAVTLLALVAGWVWSTFARSEDILNTATLWSEALDAVQFGAPLGVGIGALQWIVQRSLGPGWVVRNALGWAGAMVVLNVVAPTVGPLEDAADVAARLVFGALGGAVIGVVTGPANRRR